MSNQNRPLILCTEDNMDASDLITKFLKNIGYSVMVAENCAEKLRPISQHPFVLYIG